MASALVPVGLRPGTIGGPRGRARDGRVHIAPVPVRNTDRDQRVPAESTLNHAISGSNFPKILFQIFSNFVF